NLSIRAVESKFNKGLPIEAGAILIADVDGNVKEAIDEDLRNLEYYFLEAGASEFKIAKDEQETADIWFARRNCSQSIAMYGTLKLNEDITVPRSKLPTLLEGIDEISKKYGFKIPCFGHTGDGNVHTNVMVPDKNDKEQVKKGYEAVEEIFKLTVKLGGTLSGEHGIGLSKAPFMNLAFSEAEMNLMRNIKKAFDPNNILNPFKMGL
ncbi:glycolate oxidase subunit GlcD, partial [Campylobacter jejuni]|nr:glycolate oxidase subunit GlcD [Campylobacter jejuni]